MNLNLNCLKKKWGVSSIDVIFICIVFACTGMSVVLIKPFIFDLVLPNDASTTMKWVIYIVAIFPTYQLLLLVYGFIFGQFNFFWEKEKRLLSIFLNFFKKST